MDTYVGKYAKTNKCSAFSLHVLSYCNIPKPWSHIILWRQDSGFQERSCCSLSHTLALSFTRSPSRSLSSSLLTHSLGRGGTNAELAERRPTWPRAEHSWFISARPSSRPLSSLGTISHSRLYSPRAGRGGTPYPPEPDRNQSGSTDLPTNSGYKGIRFGWSRLLGLGISLRREASSRTTRG